MAPSDQPFFDYFFEHPQFKSIGVNAQDAKLVRLSDSTIRGFDVGVNLVNVDTAEMQNLTLEGGRIGFRISDDKKLPIEAEALIAAVGREKVRGFEQQQVNLILDSLVDIKEELVKSNQAPDESLIQRRLRYIGALFSHSANIAQLVSTVSELFAGGGNPPN